jgi:hypothetical protein
MLRMPQQAVYKKLKKARKQRRRQQGPLYPYSMKINGIDAGSFLTLAEWHGVNLDLVGWIANEILSAGPEEDLKGHIHNRVNQPGKG